MKKTLLLLMMSSAFLMNAQSWSLNGNAGTTPGTNFIGTTDNKDLVFKTNNVERVRIDKNGNLYAGEMSYFFSNGLNMNYKFASVGTNAFYLTTNDINSFIIQDVSTNYNYMRIAASDEYDSVVYLQEDGGKVLIGGKSSNLYDCANCSGYNLFVKNGIKTEKVKVEIAAENGWADYVFDKEYNLMPLHELDKFITENRHLPEVPTTEEAIRDGIELKEMNILLLKKVEELTLHVIQLNKEIQILKDNQANN